MTLFPKGFFAQNILAPKESREAKHWLRMITQAIPDIREKAKPLWREAQELNLIFSAILNSKKKKQQENK
jgi:hypothetical protein